MSYVVSTLHYNEFTLGPTTQATLVSIRIRIFFFSFFFFFAVAFELGIQGYNCHNSQTIHNISINDFSNGMHYIYMGYLEKYCLSNQFYVCFVVT